MNRDLAEELTRDLLACSGKLDRSVAIIQASADPGLFQIYRRSVGQIMGLLYIEILRDVFRQYPDLEPGATTKAVPAAEFSVPALQLVLEAQGLLTGVNTRLLDASTAEEAEVRETIEVALSMTHDIANSL